MSPAWKGGGLPTLHRAASPARVGQRRLGSLREQSKAAARPLRMLTSAARSASRITTNVASKGAGVAWLQLNIDLGMGISTVARRLVQSMAKLLRKGACTWAATEQLAGAEDARVARRLVPAEGLDVASARYRPLTCAVRSTCARDASAL